MILSVTGKKRDMNVPECEQHTITEEINCESWEDGEEKFKRSNPGYEISSTSLLVPDMKKFIIVCNAGSLSSSGGQGGDTEVVEYGRDERAARNNFEMDPVNSIYGRRIKSIREA